MEILEDDTESEAAWMHAPTKNNTATAQDPPPRRYSPPPPPDDTPRPTAERRRPRRLHPPARAVSPSGISMPCGTRLVV